MRFLIISHTVHKEQNNLLYAYSPYIKEMNIWLKYVDEVQIVAPKTNGKISNIEASYTHQNVHLNAIPSIAFTNFKTAVSSILKLPRIFFSIYRACKNADHIHLRCPGNIGLIGCFVQILFPNKIKTAKYAGNWNPKSNQPLSYKLQKWILSHTILTKNITVLVYGNWKNQTKNIKPFFTASFNNSEIEDQIERNYDSKLNFVFVGSLVKGKRPLLAIKIVEALYIQGKKVMLEIYGKGVLKSELQEYIVNNNLENIVVLKGNQKQDVIKKALKQSHFLILASKSEGWPKAVAEAMFFGVIPIATKISCVPFMLDHGKRGVLITPNADDAVIQINSYLKDTSNLKSISLLASKWSQNYTLDVFETEISKLLRS